MWNPSIGVLGRVGSQFIRGGSMAAARLSPGGTHYLVRSLPNCLTSQAINFQTRTLSRNVSFVHARLAVQGRRFLCSAAENVKVEKSLLSKLRRETGFPFSKCSTALQMHKNDYDAAVNWLHEQAEKEGWAKATKLQGRSTSEGLVGLKVEDNFAAMVEVNCETDFVGRNETFVDLVSQVTATALEHRKAVVQQNQQVNVWGGHQHLREIIPEHKLRVLSVETGNLADLVAKAIGRLGENIKISRAVTMTTEPGNVIGSYVHGPFVIGGSCMLGRYGAVVVLRPQGEVCRDAVSSLSCKVAQHVVGMNPKAIDTEDGVEQSGEGSVSENVLLEQEYLLDSSITVRDLCHREQVEVVDFVRYECGEKSEK